MAFDRVASGYRAVGAAEVFENAIVAGLDDHRMFAGEEIVLDLDVIDRLAADRGAFLGNGVFLDDHAIYAQNKPCHETPLFNPPLSAQWYFKTAVSSGAAERVIQSRARATPRARPTRH